MELNKQVDFSAIIQKKWTQNQFFKIFCGIMILGILLFLVSLKFFELDRWKCLFYILAEPGDSFMDFFNVMYHAQFKDLYAQWDFSNYLPFSYLSIMLFSFPIPAEVLQTSAETVRGNIYGIIALCTFFAVSLIPFMVMIFKNKGGNIKEKLLFCFFILFSAPFLFSIERGNIIFIALVFTTFFIFYYDSPKRYLRELALIFLACAVAIKIYPAALGILLLRDKRYKDILRLGLYVLCLVLLPFFCYNGLGDIKFFVKSIKEVSRTYVTFGYGYTLNVYVTLKVIVYAITGQEFAFLNSIFHYASYLVLLCGIGVSYFIRKRWKTIAVAVLIMILVPSISWTYSLLFMVAPLVLFFNDKDEKTFKDLIYLILFCLMFMLNIPMDAPIFLPRGYAVLMDNFCARFACLIMFIMLCCDGIKDFKMRKTQNERIR